MMLSGSTALIIAVLLNHESPFLFAVGIFSLYFVFTGNRALNSKRKDPVLSLDKWIAVIRIATGSLMILLPVLLTKNIDVVLFVFAIGGITFYIKDLQLYKKAKRLRKM